jgi:hypothetical protein
VLVHGRLLQSNSGLPPGRGALPTPPHAAPALQAMGVTGLGVTHHPAACVRGVVCANTRADTQTSATEHVARSPRVGCADLIQTEMRDSSLETRSCGCGPLTLRMTRVRAVSQRKEALDTELTTLAADLQRIESELSRATRDGHGNVRARGLPVDTLLACSGANVTLLRAPTPSGFTFRHARGTVIPACPPPPPCSAVAPAQDRTSHRASCMVSRTVWLSSDGGGV